MYVCIHKQCSDIHVVVLYLDCGVEETALYNEFMQKFFNKHFTISHPSCKKNNFDCTCCGIFLNRIDTALEI